MTAEQMRVLRYLASHYDTLNPTDLLAGPDEPGFDVPGVAAERVLVALRDLHEDGLIDGVMVAEANYPVRITGVTSLGRRTTAEA